MKKRAIFVTEMFSVKAFYCIVLIGLVFIAGKIGIREEFFSILCFIISVILFTFLDYVYAAIDRHRTSGDDHRHYEETLSRIMSIRNLDDLISGGFAFFAEYVGASSSSLYLLNRRTEEFDAYVFRDRKGEKIARAAIDADSTIMKILNSPDDIIVRRRISPKLSIEHSLVSEMDLLGADIVVPVFFRKMFMGFFTLSGPLQISREDDYATLRIFSVKIGSPYANTFLIKEMIKKRELEKENETALRVRRSFFPKHEIRNDYCDVAIVSKTHTLVSDLFYDLYSDGDTVFFCVYSSGNERYDSLVFMPSIKIILQTFIRSGMSTRDAVSRTIETFSDRALIDSRFSMTVGTIKGNFIEFLSVNMPAPVIFRDNRFSDLSAGCALRNGETVIFAGKETRKILDRKMDLVAEIVREGEALRAKKIGEHVAEAVRRLAGNDDKMVITIKCRYQQ